MTRRLVSGLYVMSVLIRKGRYMSILHEPFLYLAMSTSTSVITAKRSLCIFSLTSGKVCSRNLIVPVNIVSHRPREASDVRVHDPVNPRIIKPPQLL